MASPGPDAKAAGRMGRGAGPRTARSGKTGDSAGRRIRTGRTAPSPWSSPAWARGVDIACCTPVRSGAADGRWAASPDTHQRIRMKPAMPKGIAAATRRFAMRRSPTSVPYSPHQNKARRGSGGRAREGEVMWTLTGPPRLPWEMPPHLPDTSASPR